MTNMLHVIALLFQPLVPIVTPRAQVPGPIGPPTSAAVGEVIYYSDSAHLWRRDAGGSRVLYDAPPGWDVDGVAGDAWGNWYAAIYRDNTGDLGQVIKNGQVIFSASGEGVSDVDVAIDGTVYISTFQRVVRIDPSGAQSTVYTSPGQTIQGVAAGCREEWYAAVTGVGLVNRFGVLLSQTGVEGDVDVADGVIYYSVGHEAYLFDAAGLTLLRRAGPSAEIKCVGGTVQGDYYLGLDEKLLRKRRRLLTATDDIKDVDVVLPQISIPVRILRLENPPGLDAGIASLRTPTGADALSTVQCVVDCLNELYRSAGVLFIAEGIQAVVIPADVAGGPQPDFDGDGRLDSAEIQQLRDYLYAQPGLVPTGMIVTAPVGEVRLDGAPHSLLGIVVSGFCPSGGCGDGSLICTESAPADNLSFVTDMGDCRTFAHEVGHSFGLCHCEVTDSLMETCRTQLTEVCEVNFPGCATDCNVGTASSQVDLSCEHARRVRSVASDPDTFLGAASGGALIGCTYE